MNFWKILRGFNVDPPPPNVILTRPKQITVFIT